MIWVYRAIALLIVAGTLDYIVRQKSLAKQILGALVLIPLVLRIVAIR